MSRPACAGLAASLVVALLVTLPARPAPAAAQDPLDAVQALLEQRHLAVLGGDRDAFLATVDPQAAPEFKDHQARLFDGLRSVPLESLTFEARVRFTGDLSHELDEKYGAPTFLPETRQRWRVAGYDDRDAVDTLWHTYVERDGRWYLGGDRDLEPVGLLSARGLWDFGPVRVRRTDHVAVLSAPEQAARADELASLAGDAVAAHQQRWSRPWPGRLPVVLPASVSQLEEVLQSTVDLDKFVAFVGYTSLRDEGYVTTAPRMYIQDQNLSRYGHGFQLETLVHELNHAAVGPAAGPHIPNWVHEGVADWVALGRPRDVARPRGGDGSLPRNYQFASGSAEDILRAYRESRSLASLLSARFGPDAPGALIIRLGEVKVAPGNTDHHVDRALRELFGVGTADLEELWKQR